MGGIGFALKDWLQASIKSGKLINLDTAVDELLAT